MMQDELSNFEPFERREREVEVAARSIVALCRSDALGRGWRPKGVDEVAILLESLGYSSEVVAELWYPDLFALARDVTALIEKYVTDDERTASQGTSWFVRACRDYAIGSLYAGPWIIAVLGLAVFGASLWSSLSTPLHLATAIALGAYVAQLISGFFSQGVARRLTFYFLQDNGPLMCWTFDRLVVLSFGMIALVGVALWLLMRPFYGDPDAWLSAVFAAGSALFQLSLASLYTLRRFGWIIGISLFATLVTGLTFAVLFHRHVDLPWEPATLALEVGAIGGAVFLFTRLTLARRSRKNEEFVAPNYAPLVASTIPYALFGLCYFAAILVDRIFAGIASTSEHGFAYAATYELGADLALIAMVPVTGVINVILEALPTRILSGASIGIAEREPLGRPMARFYLVSVLALLAAAAIATILGDVVGAWALHSPRLGGDPAALFVLRGATVGYALITVGLLNAQLLFFLSRPRWALVAAVLALCASLLWCSTAAILQLPAQTMVGGLCCAALVFAVVTFVAAHHWMRHFTYAYYAAY